MDKVKSLKDTILKNYLEMDPRIPIAFILFSYLILGLTVLGFNRSPLQILATSSSCLVFEGILSLIFEKRWRWNLSALITSFSLSFLLNYSHDFFLVFIPVFLSIGSKFLFRLNNKHFFNPALFGVSMSLLLSENLITASPAYQWNGIASMSIFVLLMGLFFVIPKVNRHWLVLSFLFFYTLQTALRAFIMRHHLPFETLFLGTLSSPSFLIFTFFMITDPPTSPKDKKTQIVIGFSIALLDLLLHLRQSYYTFFYAAFILQSSRFLYFHIKNIFSTGIINSFRQFVKTRFYLRPIVFLFLFLIGNMAYTQFIHPNLKRNQLNWSFKKIPESQSHLQGSENGQIYSLVDKRIQHISKWILSVGDAVSIGDFDKDGLQDVFLTNVLKSKNVRASLYKNLGNYQFTKIEIPALELIVGDPAKYGLITNAIFVDYNNSGFPSLFLTKAFGSPILLKNVEGKNNQREFVDVTNTVLPRDLYTNSVSASFSDFNKDGLLDLIILNVWPEFLPDYSSPKRLNLFSLPEPEYENDFRMFNFMHASWNLANNGGKNLIFFQNSKHEFKMQDSDAFGLPETRWSLAVGISDFNQDNWPDIYVANDFGPDDLYFNQQGLKFENIKGTFFGTIGKDTYKGMNVSIADFDRDDSYAVYVSNVHHAFQAEGSLFWKIKNKENNSRPEITELASRKGVLNEDRFGWGAAAGDFDNNGWVDIAQANGMVDDTWDKKEEECPDYWYVNEKIARSPPSIHRYANYWGDIRGFCIYGKEKNRVYLNLGLNSRPQFYDAAESLEVTEETNSRGVASADLNNSGRLDLLFTHQFASPTLYQNRVLSSQKAMDWITFDLESLNSQCNRDAIGSTVKLMVKNRDGTRFSIKSEKQLASGFSSQSDSRLHFGLGEQAYEVEAEINWCYGLKVEKKINLNKNKIYKFFLGK